MQQLYDFADQHNVTAIGGYHRTIGTGYFLVCGFSLILRNHIFISGPRAEDIAFYRQYTASE